MFSRSKWRLLTFITGILLANTIHSLGPSASNQIPALTNPEIGGFRAGHESAAKIPQQTLVRNLLSPQEIFSTVDHVRFMERRVDTPETTGGEKGAESVATGNQIGSFRLQGKLENFTSNDNQRMYTVPNVTKVARGDFNDEFMYDDSDDDRTVGVIDTRTIRPDLPTSLQKQPPKLPTSQRPSFVPQGYQEDRFDFAEFLMPNQVPFQVPNGEFRREHRIGRTVVFPGEESISQEAARIKSIINLESSIPVPKSLPSLLPNSGINVSPLGVPIQRQAFSPSPYFPPKSYELFSDYPGPPKHPIFPQQNPNQQIQQIQQLQQNQQNQNPNQWRSRSPRVIFPEGNASPYSSDNVVFR